MPEWVAIVVGWGIAAVTLGISAWMNWRQAKRLREESELDRQRIENEAQQFKATIELERAKFQAEATRWRQEHRDLKRAEIAGEVLVGLVGYLRELRFMTGLHIDVPADEPDALRKRIAERWPAFQPHVEAFADLRAKCAAFLPDDALALCDQIYELETRIYSAQSIQATSIGPYVATRDLWEEGFGDKARKKIAEFERKARAVLRPLALLDAATTAESDGDASVSAAEHDVARAAHVSEAPTAPPARVPVVDVTEAASDEVPAVDPDAPREGAAARGGRRDGTR